jgi:hypothetical protein
MYASWDLAIGLISLMKSLYVLLVPTSIDHVSKAGFLLLLISRCERTEIHSLSVTVLNVIGRQ